MKKNVCEQTFLKVKLNRHVTLLTRGFQQRTVKQRLE